MKIEKFKEKEIPYEALEKFGISQEMVDDFPQKVMFDFLSSRQTPVLPISVEDEKGTKVSAKARLVLKRNDEGEPEVYFMPVLETGSFMAYSNKQQLLLQEGKAILANHPDSDSEYDFVQYDRDTNQVVTVPTPVIGRNIKLLTDMLEMDGEDIEKLQAGDILTKKTEKGEDISFGVDLLSETGIRISSGGALEWMEKGKNIEPYNFGLYGCWIADGTDGMSYVPEEQYTDEIKTEQKRAEQRHVSETENKGIHA